MNLRICETTKIEYFDSNISYGGSKFFDLNNKHYLNNQQKFIEQCCICGKGIKNDKNLFLTRGLNNPLCLVNRKDVELLEKTNSDMGCYYLGSECGRQVKKQLIKAGLNWKDYLTN
jgi:hypothetical protein